MALSPDELGQIRDIVRTELDQRRSNTKTLGIVVLLFAAVVLAVLFFHILVIAGFTIWHLYHR